MNVRKWCFGERERERLWCEASSRAKSLAVSQMAALPGIRQQCFPVEGRVWTGMVSTPGSTSHSRARDNECVCTWILCAVCDRICRVVVESEGALYPVSLHRAAADLSMQSHIRLSLSPLYVCVCVEGCSVLSPVPVCVRAPVPLCILPSFVG